MNAPQSPPTTVRCSLCNGEMTVVSLSSLGSYAVCPCGRTTATTHVMQTVPTGVPDYDAGEVGDYQP